MDPNPDLLTTKEVAELLRTTTRSVLRLASAGKLKAVRYSQRQFRYHRRDVEALRGTPATEEPEHPSGLTGEHDVVLDAINSECLHQ